MSTQATTKKAVAKKPRVPKAPKKDGASDKAPVALSPNKPPPLEVPKSPKASSKSPKASHEPPKSPKVSSKSPKASHKPPKSPQPRDSADEEPSLEDVEKIADTIEAAMQAAQDAESPTLLKRIDMLCERVSKGDIAYHKITKELKSIKKDISKVQKQHKKKDKTKKRVGSNLSGIQKPGKLTNEMYEFTGFDPSKEYSRVDVTKHICNYIREHDLQNPDDKRHIMIEKDPSLMKALNYSTGTDPKLSYPLIQRFIKVHVTKPEKASK